MPLNQSSYKDKLIKKKIILSLSCQLPVISRPPVLICLWHQSQGVNSFVNCFSKGGILLHFPTFVLFMTNNKIITICFRITIKDERLLTYYCKQKKRFFKRLDFCNQIQCFTTNNDPTFYMCVFIWPYFKLIRT